MEGVSSIKSGTDLNVRHMPTVPTELSPQTCCSYRGFLAEPRSTQPRSTKATSTGNPTDEEPGTSATATHSRGPANVALDSGERGHTSP